MTNKGIANILVENERYAKIEIRICGKRMLPDEAMKMLVRRVGETAKHFFDDMTIGKL